jgi:hypothetical protein
MLMSKDGYQVIFDKLQIDKNRLLKIGIEEIIKIDHEEAKENWHKLIERINKDEEVYIRGYGRNGSNSNLYIDLYKNVLNISNIKIDSTNNSQPKRIIEKLTGQKRNKDIYNYQISHVFGFTKNPYCFTAPWNIVYIPKLLDPFTGHESKGELTEKFTNQLKREIYNKYETIIEEYNTIIEKGNYKNKIDVYCNKLLSIKEYSDKQIERFRKDAKEQWKKIKIQY